MHKHKFRFDNPNSAPYPSTDSCACGVYRDYAPNHHPYRLIEIDGRLEKIDEGMVDLVERLQLAGVRTGHCCQGGCMDFPNIDGDISPEEVLALIEQMADKPLHPGYITCHVEDAQVAEPIIREFFKIIDMQPSVTWRKSFDGRGTSFHIRGHACPVCNEALLSLLS